MGLKTITAKLDEELVGAVMRLAKERKVTLTDVVREALERTLRQAIAGPAVVVRLRADDGMAVMPPTSPTLTAPPLAEPLVRLLDKLGLSNEQYEVAPGVWVRQWTGDRGACQRPGCGHVEMAHYMEPIHGVVCRMPGCGCMGYWGPAEKRAMPEVLKQLRSTVLPGA